MSRFWATTIFLTLVLTIGCKPDVMTTGGGNTSPSKTAKTSAQDNAPQSYVLKTTHVVLAEVPGPGVPTREEVDSWFRSALVGQGMLKEAAAGASIDASIPHASLKATYRAAYKDMADGSGQIVGSVFVSATLSLYTPGKPRTEVYRAEAFVGESLDNGQKPEVALPKLVRKIVGEIAANLEAQFKIAHGDDEVLLGLLDPKSQDAELLTLVVGEVRRRKLKTAADKLKMLLTHPNRDVVNVAASALGELGTRAMVPALIDAGSRVEPLDRLPVLYALGELGGPTAEIYLETLSKNAMDPTVKRAAEAALKRARITPTP